MFAARGGFERFCEGGCSEGEIKEAGTGDFDFVAPFGDIEFGEDVGGELARVHFARLGQGHQGVALVIAEFRVGGGADQDGGGVGVGEDGADGLLQADFDLFMRKHGGI